MDSSEQLEDIDIKSTSSIPPFLNALEERLHKLPSVALMQYVLRYAERDIHFLKISEIALIGKEGQQGQIGQLVQSILYPYTSGSVDLDYAGVAQLTQKLQNVISAIHYLIDTVQARSAFYGFGSLLMGMEDSLLLISDGDDEIQLVMEDLTALIYRFIALDDDWIMDQLFDLCLPLFSKGQFLNYGLEPPFLDVLKVTARSPLQLRMAIESINRRISQRDMLFIGGDDVALLLVVKRALVGKLSLT